MKDHINSARLSRLTLTIGILFSGFGVSRPAYAQTDVPSNGIHVGQVKQFDDRTLQQTFASIQNSLASLQFINLDQLTAAVGNIQGSTARQTASSVALNASLPTHTGTDTTTFTSSPPPSGSPAGTPNTDTTEHTNTTTTTPAPPAAATASTPSTNSDLKPFSDVKLGPQDLLAEQMELTYQALNLRLLLDRSISDRVISVKGEFDGIPKTSTLNRLQAVLGFQISVEPKYKNAVADAQITITTVRADNKFDAPSLVSLIPREKTYNVATFTSDAKAFGLGAILQPFSLGVNSSNANSSLFLVRDVDTIAFERPAQPASDDKPQSLRFAWQFRPVLNRSAVEAGTRQVYAVLALPSQTGSTFSGLVSVRTVWRCFDPKSKVVGEEIAGSETNQDLGRVTIDAVESTEDNLKPVVLQTEAHDAGDGKVLISAVGLNFFPGTTATLGSSTFESGDVFTVQSEHRVRLLADVSKLALFDPILSGPYGDSIPLVGPAANVPGPNFPFTLNAEESKVVPTTSTMSHVTVVLNGPVERIKTVRQGKGKLLLDTTGAPFIISVGQKVFGLSNEPVTQSVNATGDALSIEFDISTQLLRDNPRIVVQKLLAGRQNALTWAHTLPSDFSVDRLVNLNKDSTSEKIGLVGRGLAGQLTIYAGDYKIANSKDDIQTDTFRSFTIPSDKLAKASTIVLQRQALPLVLLSLSGSPAPPAAKPEIESIDPVNQGDVKSLIVKGKNLSSIKTVTFIYDAGASAGDPVKSAALPFTLDEETSSYRLLALKTLTETAGEKELTLELTDGTKVTYKMTVLPSKTK